MVAVSRVGGGDNVSRSSVNESGSGLGQMRADDINKMSANQFSDKFKNASIKDLGSVLANPDVNSAKKLEALGELLDKLGKLEGDSKNKNKIGKGSCGGAGGADSAKNEDSVDDLEELLKKLKDKLKHGKKLSNDDITKLQKDIAAVSAMQSTQSAQVSKGDIK